MTVRRFTPERERHLRMQPYDRSERLTPTEQIRQDQAECIHQFTDFGYCWWCGAWEEVSE